MSMISCPNCGGEISERSKKCVHCGYALVEDAKVVCTECGTEVDSSAAFCPKCGCPVNESDSPQKVEVTKVNVSSVISKKVVFGLLIAVMTIAGIFYGVKYTQEKKAIEEAVKQKEDYQSTLELASLMMLQGASDAETCGNLVRKVWSNCIYKERDVETDKYTCDSRGSGWFYDDFNDALMALYDDSSFQEKINGIKSGQETVATMMKDLKNPPDEMADAYEDIQNFYMSYLTLTEMVVNPTGSLSSFSSDFSDADTDVSNAYSRMKLYLE